MAESESTSDRRDARSGERWIKPAEYRPPALARKRPLLPLLILAATVTGGLAVAGTLWFVLTMRAVEIEVVPEPDRISLDGLTLRIGENWLARPGQYRVAAAHPGYRDLQQQIQVSADEPARFEFQLEPLPGKVSFSGTPRDAEIRVDGDAAGNAPLEDLALDGGEYQLEIRHPDYLPERRLLVVEGRGESQAVDFDLTPATAQIEVSSAPAEAEITVNGESAGTTPATLKLDAGEQRIALSRPGFRTWSETITVEGGVARALPEVDLQPAPAGIAIRSDPDGAEVTLDGEVVGTAPLEVELEPDRPITIALSLAGYRTLTRTLTPQADVQSTLRGELEPINAVLEVRADPDDARVFIDREPAGTVGPEGLQFELPAREYALVFRRQGYADAEREVRLDPDQPTEVAVDMLTELEARMARVQPLIRAADGQTLQLVEPGAFDMGSPRGQQGRQANERQRPVRLERLFYMGLHEVTNEQFRRFRPQHSSGIAGDETLDNDEQPVVRVSFDDAAAFCNWLSEREGLEPAYRSTRRGYRLVEPITRGYRLPTEAEWTWVARFAGARKLKYPWGESMPPPPNAGNFADQSAAGLVSSVLPDYDDGRPASALVGAFEPNTLGFYDFGGNVSEWTGDGYEIRLNQSVEPEIDPVNNTSGPHRVVRGSSWRHAGITELRLAWRERVGEARDDLGFRIVRYAE
ncbi:MAG: SUMF1/EgtB/PvdO family nonheme iron enzyme [Wenzhouxiangellaceae bacterium]|nr:SUMF1/EgtB/PvdO family nonheme iron enzyme [Wenzhouxiangellaceae bacterium]